MTLYSELLERHRVRPVEAVYWLLLVMIVFVFSHYLAIATTVVVMALFALSLDLVLGFAGIVTLGHAAYFGIGAYAASLLALGGLHEAIFGALLAGITAAIVALLLGPLLLLLEGLPLIMVTMAIGAILFEAANKASWLTGGDDGLRGFEFTPLLGFFDWTIFGYTAYFYSLAWLFVLFVVARRVVGSPFGVALQGIRENQVRMRLIGAPVVGHLVRAYVLSAFMAGIAGAIYAQTNQFVSLEVLSTDTSVDVVVMLVLGGIGRLYGGLVGAPVYVLVKHFAAQWNPYNWMFLIGALLIVAVRFGHGGLLGILSTARGSVLGLGRRRTGGTK
jgi:branched-chain amino acid transport system permease protein